MDEILNLIESVSEGFPSYSFSARPHSGVGIVSDSEPEVPGSIFGAAKYFHLLLLSSVTGESMLT